jgi:pyruvate/2-oxoglutarate dehydrogenase complex dihydrolipoamide dehydrogenase (E3) component
MVEFARTAAEGRITAVPKGLDLLRGAAHFIAPKTLEVHLTSGERQQITAPTIFINAGQRPKPLQITGAESVPVLTSTTIMELDTLPDHLVIIGGGYIALEFGQMFRRFGSQVTIIEPSPRLLIRGRHFLDMRGVRVLQISAEAQSFLERS